MRRYTAHLSLVAVNILCVLSVGAAPPSHAEFFQPVTPPRPFQVMQHRGASQQAPENTRPAYERSIEDQLEWVEVDVALTKDGRHVIFHDSEVDGKTNGKGRIRDLSLAELKKLDAGKWFADCFAGEHILTLEECFKIAKDRVNLYLDSKDTDPVLMAREILRAGMQNQVVVFSDLDKLAKVRAASKGRIPCMPKWHPQFGTDRWVEKWHPAAVEINANEVTSEICDFFHGKNVKVQAKTLGRDDNPETWDKMIGSGVDWLQTDLAEEILAHRLWTGLKARPVQMSLHRGASRYAPENTIPALEKAIRLGADYVECDVHTSSDGEYFLLHDGNLDRTTNGTGTIKRLDAAAIRALDAGAWFGKYTKGTKIPTLDEALKVLGGNTNLYLDAKDIPAKALADKLAAAGLVDRTVVCQHPDYLRELKSLNPSIRGLCPLTDPKDVDTLHASVRPYAFDAVWGILSKELLQHCHDLGVKVFSDALGDHERIEEYQRAITMGIDLIQTDYPLRLIRAVETLSTSEGR